MKLYKILPAYINNRWETKKLKFSEGSNSNNLRIADIRYFSIQILISCHYIHSAFKNIPNPVIFTLFYQIRMHYGKKWNKAQINVRQNLTLYKLPVLTFSELSLGSGSFFGDQSRWNPMPKIHKTKLYDI